MHRGSLEEDGEEGDEVKGSNGAAAAFLSPRSPLSGRETPDLGPGGRQHHSLFSSARGPTRFRFVGSKAPSEGGGASSSDCAKYDILLIGMQGVGKTQFCRKFMFGGNDKPEPTMGMRKYVGYYRDEETKKLARVRIVDTQGWHRAFHLTGSYFRKVHAIVFMADLCNRESLQLLYTSIFKHVEDKNLGHEFGTVMDVLLLNKRDSPSVQVEDLEVVDFVDKHKCGKMNFSNVYRVSALRDSKERIRGIVAHLLQRLSAKSFSNHPGWALAKDSVFFDVEEAHQEDTKRTSGCC